MTGPDDGPPPADGLRSRRSSSALLVPILAMGLLLRLYGIANRGFWWDEIALWREGLTLDFRAHAAFLPGLVTALFMRATSNYGSFVAHIPPVIFGTIAIGAAYLLAKELFDSRTALAAAFLAAISPMTIYYSQEARPYALLQLLTTLLIYTFIRAANDCSYRNWELFTLVAVLCGHTHLISTHILAGLTAAFVVSLTIERLRTGRLVKPRRILFFTASLLITFCVGYTWAFFRNDLTTVLEGQHPGGLATFLRVSVGALGAGLPVRLSVQGWLVWLALPSVLLAIVGAWTLVRRNPTAALSLAFSLLVSLGALYLTLGVKASWPWLRYLSHLLIPTIILTAAGWSVFFFRGRVVSVLTFLLLCGCFTPGFVWWASQATDLRSNDYRWRAATVHSKEQGLAGVIYPTHRTRYSDETLRNIDLYRLYREDSLPEYIVGAGIAPLTLEPSRVGGVPLPTRGALQYRLPKGRYAVVSRGGLAFITLNRAYPITYAELVDRGLVRF